MASTNVVLQFIKKKPIVRGILAYAIIWPTSNVIQQTIAGRRWPNYNWAEVGRFCFFGSCIVAPVLYGWIRFSSRMWPRSTFRTAIHKATVEQISYGPLAMICFFFGMSLLEGKTFKQSSEEVKKKFFPTYKVGVCVWPVLQTINFCWISEKNRVPYVSICSLGWTCFLAYMKQLDAKKQVPLPNNPQLQQIQQLQPTPQPIIMKQLL